MIVSAFTVGLFSHALLQIFIFRLCLKKAQDTQFFSDSPWFIPWGIFVYGDGLILAPFWALSSVVLSFFTPLIALKYWLLFVAVRSAYEVIYWLLHQAHQKTYNPPLFRRISWLTPEQSAILYQLMNTCQVISAIALLVFL